MSNLGGIPVRNTATLVTPDTRMCVLCYAPSGFGKTTLGATLDKLTKEFMQKPTLIVAVEAGEGGGTSSIQEFGVDFVMPADLNDVEKILAALATDTTYGGVVMDSSTELVKRFIQPYALKFPSREKVPTRTAGVPERSDYQTMGEKARQIFNRLINLTTVADPRVRKHLLVTALEQDKTDERGALTSIQPALPGAMAGTATAMFQTVLGISIKPKVIPDPDNPGKTKRINERVLISDGDGVRHSKDRMKLFPNGCEPDLAEIYRKYWLPKIEQTTQDVAALDNN
jgi:hypothetical protein